MPPKRILHDDDSDCDSEYPAALVESVSSETWDSPTKLARKYQQPLKRRQKSLARQNSMIEKDDDPWGGNTGNEDESAEYGPGDVVRSDLEMLGPQGTATGGNFSDAQLSNYLEAVESFSAGFVHIEGAIFVVEGWDLQREQSTAGWYHLQYLWIGGSLHVACTCTQGILGGCIHQEFFKTFETEPMLREVSDNGVLEAKSTIFLRQQLPNSTDFVTMMSAMSTSSSALKGRAIVTHTSSSVNGGIWSCSKDTSITAACVHISASRKALQELLGGTDNTESGVLVGTIKARPFASLARTGSISHLPVLPPLAATLKSDNDLYKRPIPFRNPPSAILKLSEDSSCPCASGRTFFEPSAPRHTRTCRIYCLHTVFSTQIEVQPCRTCPPSRRRAIGPDLRKDGLFNFNNSVILSHELLDEYTMSFVQSETPFTAYVSVVGQRYALSGSVFIGEDLFRSVWFSYVSLQALENDMSCLRCGPSPDTVIWDGITLAFGRKHLSSTLKPPTMTSADSRIRSKVKNQPRQQLIVEASLRKCLRQCLKQPCDGIASSEDSNEESSSTPRQIEHRAEQLEEYLNRVQEVYTGLTALCPALGTLFLNLYGAVALLEKRAVPVTYHSFFLQVAAEESVLQMINGASLACLRRFLSDPQSGRITDVISIPGVYKVLQLHPSPEALVPILEWMECRATAVLDALLVEPELTNPLIKLEEVDWRLSGCVYSLPQIRHRPVYPNLKTDQKKDTGSKPRGDQCGKYYTQYGERRLTGGIMVVWCTHSICYGFHCIPESEGRNDVFSAMITRWPTAPKRVIYDFACALGPYCMLREPAFFKDTLFAIDLFHAMGHTKCSPAAFLSEYANVDPRLVPINSSAGECGNSSLRRIRKSVSYMTQDRAVLYSKIFLSIWNRLRLRRME